MEIFSFRNLASLFVGFFAKDEKGLLIGSLITSAGIWLCLFILQGFGLYAMASHRNFKRKWLAFCPFVNLLYMGRLVGTCYVFNQRMKRAGLYTMIAQIVTTLFLAINTACELYLYINHGLPGVDQHWSNLSGFSGFVASVYEFSGVFALIPELCYTLLVIVLTVGLYKKYAPRNYMILAILSFMFPIRFVIIFVLRHNDSIDYEAYMRARTEAYIRQQQQYYGYGNPYARPYQPPYGGTPTQNQNGANAGEDPFAEFGSAPNQTPNTGDSTTEPNDPDDFFV
jgi:hypothetical protein